MRTSPFRRLDEVVQQISDRFIAKEFDAVEVDLHAVQEQGRPGSARAALLPFTAAGRSGHPRDGAAHRGPSGKPLYLVEPDRGRVLAALLPLIVKAELFCVVLEAMLCEQAQSPSPCAAHRTTRSP